METNLIIFLGFFIGVVCLVVLQVQIFSVKKRILDLFGKDSRDNVAEVLEKYVKGVKKHFSDIEELKKFSTELYKLAERSIQKVGIVRYNPFQEVGGNQSFSLVLLDLKNNGILVTSLFGREGTRVYSKPIKDGKSEYFLSEEEKKALEEAIKNKRSLDVSKKE